MESKLRRFEEIARRAFLFSAPIARDVLIIPETPIYAYSSTYHDVLREPFDRVWQTCGRLGSTNYTDGEWSGEISRH
jgi:hypothetical protein